ncbi:ribosomal RNA-processing protein 8 [Phyllopteryx taeniolatus]|uniref:ribosomal RNA-processing protein 8 n=1 Tax=Phyllopteryx taeniolatus TaxID=161469 RepID=UPI002AD52633|nr:ribosomal RNA-processing protein 8 [Phyllopteryx taeniolatus]
MFHEDEDWNDAADVLSPSVVKKKPNSTNGKSKNVGRKSLLRTLQTLGSMPDRKGDGRRRAESAAEAAAAHAPKRKKKRKHRTKQGTAATTGEQDNTSVVTTATKKQKVEKKIGVPKGKKAPAGETEGDDISQKPAGDVSQLSRQQWKNRMKNKRRCKNKYCQDKPEEELQKADKPLPTTHSDINSGKRVEVRNEEILPQKRKKTEDDDVSTGTLRIKTAKKERKNAIDGSKQEAGDSHADRQKAELSKAERLKRERLRKLLRRAGPEVPKEAEAVLQEAAEDRSTLLRWRMERRLEAARFRYINERLYSCTGGEAQRMFRQDPRAFQIYHKGYTAQVRRWPVRPVDAVIAYIQKKPHSLVVADFGCGDCKIALSVKNKVHSFDLVATCDLVTACNMANVPLPDGSVDIAVFCLSLMGTNLADFLAEANRVLKRGGVLKIAEVASRFDDVRNFLNALVKLGFKMVSKDTDNTHFYSFEFTKTGDAPANLKKFGLQLKACLYKKR